MKDKKEKKTTGKSGSSRKIAATVFIIVSICVLVGMAVVIMLHRNKPVYTPTSDVYTLIYQNQMYDENGNLVNDGVLEFKLGPDVTGKEYNVKVWCTENDEGLGETYISLDGGKKQIVSDSDGTSGYLRDVIGEIDKNGKPVIVVNMDFMSDDYFFTMYTIKDNALKLCGSDWASIDLVNDDGTFKANYCVDFFGTWIAERTIELVGDNVKLRAGDYMLNNFDGSARPLTAKADVPAEFQDDNGNYTEGKIKAGAVITPYSTDGKSYMIFTDENGKKGRIKATFDEGFTVVNGVHDDELFDGVQYAG